LDLTINDFIRTTEPRHKKVVQAVLTKLHKAGHFYKAPYVGFYSTKEETFLTEKDRRPDGTFDPVYGEVVELAEENYYFKLKEHQGWLIEYIEQNPDFIYPKARRNQVLGFLKSTELADLCITRPASRLNWGIPIPFDPAYVTYVWFDALVNYITVPEVQGDPELGRAVELAGDTPEPRSLWPADAHIIGKDILTFHAVYWPIMLKAIGLPQPKRLLVHGWWQKDDQKMSKTLGNIVDPLAVIREWGLDAFRYFVIRELDIGPDGNWTDHGFESRYNSELANGLGNLVNRSLSMLQRYREGKVPSISNELTADAEQVVTQTIGQLRAFELQAGLESIWRLVNRANLYVEQTAPFKLAKDPTQAARLDEVLYNLVEVCRILAVLLHPYIPAAAGRIYSQLGLGTPGRFSEAAWGGLRPGHKIGAAQPLFPRKDR
jgi:methionyl-tRNA synthetase